MKIADVFSRGMLCCATVFFACAFAYGLSGGDEAGPPVPSVELKTVATENGLITVAASAKYDDGKTHVESLSVSPAEALGGWRWRAAEGAALEVTVRGCSDNTACWAPQKSKWVWDAGQGRYVEERGRQAEKPAAPAASAPGRDADGSERAFEVRGPKRDIMGVDEFIAFLRNKEQGGGILETASLPILLLLVLLGGFMINLTPCVLPLIPVNLAIIGAGARAIGKNGTTRRDGALRGGAYGLGIATAYGALGLAAALAGVAFGAIQSNPWFNAAIALVFALLGLSLLDLFFIDFTRFVSPGRGRAGSLAAAFAAGALSAVLAGACVAPVLGSVLLMTAKGVASGAYAAAALPFLLGAGMALPWPFIGAGMSLLPKPGAWMGAVKKIFALCVFALAAYYAKIAYRGWSPLRDAESETTGTFPARFVKAAEEGRPLLVDCWATWCKNCAAMDKVLEDPRVKEELENFVVVKLQVVQEEDFDELARIPGFEDVHWLPAFKIFTFPGAKAGGAEGGAR